MQAVTVDREKYIGGSDIPIIMGISPFKKRYNLLMEKAGILEDSFTGNEFTEYGNIMEPKIREFINTNGKYYDEEFIEDKKIIGNIRCHVDGFNGKCILEIKTTSQIHDKAEDYKIYLVQLLFYMEYYKIGNGLLAVYQRPDDFSEEFDEERLKIYEVKIEDYEYLINQINVSVDLFLKDLERLKENPFMTEEELVPIDIARTSKEIVLLEEELVKMKELETRLKSAKAELKAGMKKAGIKSWSLPNGTKITLVEDTPDTEIEVEDYDMDKFINENKELYEEYNVKLTKYKIIKKEMKKGRQGYVKITFPKR